MKPVSGQKCQLNGPWVAGVEVVPGKIVSEADVQLLQWGARLAI